MQAFAPCMTVDTERRKKLRNRPRSLVYVELESANGGMMRDLSEEGFALRAMMPLRAGGKTQFAFSLDEGTRISGEGRIVWIKEDGRVAGIEFCGISHSARVQIRRWLNRADQPAGRGPKVPAIAVAEPPTREELREEARSTLSRAAQPSVEAAKTAPSPEPEIAAIVIPAPPRLEEPREEGGRALPRLVLPSVESAETAPLPEPEIAPSALLQPAELVDFAEVPMESATAPSPEVQTELRDISPETAPVAALEPLVTEAAIDPLLALGLEIEFSGTLDERRASRSLLMRVIGMMLVLTLIAGAVVFHREVGHALIWLGQIIAGKDEARVPQSSVAEPPAQATVVPETTGPVSSPGSSPEGDRAAPSETRSAATNRVMEVPPVLPAEPTASTKARSAPALQPTSQQKRVPAPSNSSGTATDDGQQEYQRAEQILRNRSSEEELAVGVRLLWVAVEKGNADAEVALAGLYRQGKGVARNCDQARVLLSAAARKGSAEAQKHLEELVRGGCQ
ncbi:MAG: PilZ domain-containing protein [Candidatus Acidiferrum sp.]